MSLEEYGEAPCPSDRCPMCTGESCAKCGAGCWDSSVKDCEHDVVERHEYGGREKEGA
jgi:hypothetical protein